MKNEKNNTPAAVSEGLTPTDHETMTRCLSRLAERYPFISVTFLGTSLLGRSIPLVSIGKEGAPSVLYVAAHHGMEWICTAALLRFIDDVSSAYEKGKKVFGISAKVLFETRLIQIIPMLNPDGVELQINGLGDDTLLSERLIGMNGGENFEKWQANARGVDLNHNYDAGFYEYKKLEKEAGILSGCATRFSGEFPESEPETGALCNYVRWNKNIKGALTLHTQGEEIYCSAKDDMERKCRNVGKLLEKFTGYKLSVPENMASYGGMTDWMVEKMKIPSFTLECGKGENPLPEGELPSIYLKLREALFTFPILV